MSIKWFVILISCSAFLISCNHVNQVSQPTGYAMNEIDQPQIMYNDNIYFYEATGFHEELPESFTKVGVVESVDNENPPSHNFSGSRVELGQELFADSIIRSVLYIRYDNGFAKFSCSDTSGPIESEGRADHNQIYVDMSERTIRIPEQSILNIYKNTYLGREKMEDTNMVTMLCQDINQSELVQIYVDAQEVIRAEAMGDFIQYPMSLETLCMDDEISINLLSKTESEYYVQLTFAIPDDHLKNSSSFDLDDPTDGMRHINCFVKSEKLYRDIERLWGPRVSIEMLQNPEEIVIGYNHLNSYHAGKYQDMIEVFGKEDSMKFTQSLLKEAHKVFDDHSFGITITIVLHDNRKIDIYYADDSCPMFEFEGESYSLETNGTAASIVKAYIQKLEEKIKDQELN